MRTNEMSNVSRIRLRKDKKAVSLMVGYVLLITLAIVMGIVAYNWMKTYLPREINQCPDGASLFIKDATFDDTMSQLTLTLKNNGRFNILGYYIYATNSSEQQVATIDISYYWASGGYRVGTGGSGSYISFAQGAGNSLIANEEAVHVFTIPSEIGTLYSISVIPTRIETEENKERFTVCSNLGVRGFVGEAGGGGGPVCSAPACNPLDENQYCLNEQWASCSSGQICSEGACITPATCTQGEVQTGTECMVCNANGDAYEPDNSKCTVAGETCNSVTGMCEALCGNGQLDSGEICDGNSQSCTINGYSGTQICNTQCNGWNTCTTTQFCGDGTTNGNEQCDDGNTLDNDACKNDCTLSPTTDCSNNCITSGYEWGYCTSQSTCSDVGGTNEFSGNTFCGAGLGRCCCLP